MSTRLLVAGCVALMSVALVSAQAGQTARQSNPASQAPAKTAVAAPDAAAQRALIDQYCVTCHNVKLKTANLLLDQLDLAHLGEHAEVAEKVVRKLRAGMMPPTGMRRPDAATLDALIRWMENELDRSAVTNLPPPGLHRLNRAYGTVIRSI